jgi:hypothetical protein
VGEDDRREERTMEDWMDRLAEALGEEPLDAAQTDRLLAASRDVAHRVERKLTPLSMFLLGLSAGRSVAAGTDRGRAIGDALRTFDGLLPPGGTEG